MSPRSSKPVPSVESAATVEPPPASSLRSAGRALLDYFASPPPEMRQMDAAWQEALAMYGDEDSDAWVAALENGTHPLCRLRTT